MYLKRSVFKKSQKSVKFYLWKIIFFSVFNNIFWLMCREVTVFFWHKDLSHAYVPDTLNVFIKSTENCLEPLKNSSQNLRFSQNIPTWLWVSFFKISTFFPFSWDIIQSVYRKIRIFYRRKDIHEVDLPNALNVFIKYTEYFPEALVQKFSTQNMNFLSEYSNLTWAVCLPHVLSWNFFQMPLENFL